MTPATEIGSQTSTSSGRSVNACQHIAGQRAQKSTTGARAPRGGGASTLMVVVLIVNSFLQSDWPLSSAVGCA